MIVAVAVAFAIVTISVILWMQRAFEQINQRLDLLLEKIEKCNTR